jgi:hypothetical protein
MFKEFMDVRDRHIHAGVEEGQHFSRPTYLMKEDWGKDQLPLESFTE